MMAHWYFRIRSNLFQLVTRWSWRNRRDRRATTKIQDLQHRGKEFSIHGLPGQVSDLLIFLFSKPKAKTTSKPNSEVVLEDRKRSKKNRHGRERRAEIQVVTMLLITITARLSPRS